MFVWCLACYVVSRTHVKSCVQTWTTCCTVSASPQNELESFDHINWHCGKVTLKSSWDFSQASRNSNVFPSKHFFLKLPRLMGFRCSVWTSQQLDKLKYSAYLHPLLVFPNSYLSSVYFLFWARPKTLGLHFLFHALHSELVFPLNTTRTCLCKTCQFSALTSRLSPGFLSKFVSASRIDFTWKSTWHPQKI